MERLIYIFNKYKFSILLALLLLVVFVIFLHDHINISFAIINISFIFFILILIGKVKNKNIRGALISVTSLILSTATFFALLFQSPLSLGNIASFFETNLSEVYALPIHLYVMFVIYLLCATIILFRVIYELKWMLSKRKLLLILLGMIILINLSAIVIPYYRNSGFLIGYKRDFKELPLQTIYTHSSLRSPLLYGDVLGLLVYFAEKYDFWKYGDTQRELPKGVSKKKGGGFVPTIYLVVGESAYRGRMSLYGYEIATTPFLDSTARVAPSTINYYKGISVANITRDAIRFSLSFASPFNRKAFWEEKNVVDIANDANYNTSWLSNQGQAGLYDNYPSYIARSSNSTYFESKLYKEDLDLLSLLGLYHEKGEPQLLSMHLIGSHFPFDERYDVFDDSYFESFDTIYMDNRSIFDYNKSIYHTDRFLRALYDYTIKEDESSIIVYFSDHGASPNRGIHGLQNAALSEYEIPIVLLKNNVPINTDSIVAKYIDRQTGLINNLSISYILAELMGYSVDSAVVAKAVCEGRYVMKVSGDTGLFGEEQ